MKKIYLVLACFALFVSCNKANVNSEEDVGVRKPEFPSGNSYERALEVANAAPELFATSSTKSFGKRVAHGVAVVSENTATKSGAADTLMYIFNYAGEDGYVIVPNDERKGFVLAYSDSGNFNIADTSVNEVARYVMNNAIEYCEAPVIDDNAETKWNIDQIEYKKYAKYFSNQQGNGCSKLKSVDSYDFEKPGPSGYADSYYVTQGCKAQLSVMYLAPGGIDPLLTTKWGQQFPYNLKAPVIDGELAVAGCLATATAQVVAYHSFPPKYPTGTYIQGYYYGDTDTRIADFRKYVGGTDPGPGVRDYISRLFRVIGDKLNNSWGTAGSGGTSAAYFRITPVFEWLGYTNTSALKTYDVTELVQSLNDGYPVIIAASDTSPEKLGGHAFVIDGYKSMLRGYNYCYFDANGVFHKRALTIYSTPDPAQKYVHVNFGWDGSYNGFYLSNVLDTSDRDSWFGTKSNFNGGTNMITFIHP